MSMTFSHAQTVRAAITPGSKRHLRTSSYRLQSDAIPRPAREPAPGPDMRVLFVGAGNINFGSDEGPWNHSQRLEQKLGSRLKVIGVVDPVVDRAQTVLAAKGLTLAGDAYSIAEVYPSISAAVSALRSTPPDLIILGSPPAFRGRRDASEGLNAEDQLTEAFSKAAMFVEKPVSTGPVDEAWAVGDLLESRKDNLVSVGYMLRYSAAAQKMKDIIKENGLTVMMTSARYVMAYEFSRKLAWWNKAIDCGPIVEQATHFCDLSRYFGGEVDLKSVMAHSLEWYETPGQLSKMNVDESKVPEDERIPRFTSATWKYDTGAIGHLEHGVALQGTAFSTEFTVFADGYQLKLSDPYNHPVLYVRRPGSDSEEVHQFNDDDPFYSEMSTFIDMYDKGSSDVPILSSFADAVKTYEMTWAIRWASERTRRPREAGL